MDVGILCYRLYVVGKVWASCILIGLRMPANEFLVLATTKLIRSSFVLVFAQRLILLTFALPMIFCEKPSVV